MKEIIKLGKADEIPDDAVYYAVTSKNAQGEREVTLWLKGWCPECDGINRHFEGCLAIE